MSAMNLPPDIRVALAHHWAVSMRGGEKTLSALAELFPDAPIYTTLARPTQLDAVLQNRRLYTSFLQRFADRPNIQQRALPLMPRAARSLSIDDADIALCSDAGIIKAIRTDPATLKVCYCHSPMRYIWDLYKEYYAAAGPLTRLGMRLFAPRLRKADRRAADTIDAFIANSRHVAERIGRHYGRPCVVIPPPVATDYPTADAPPDDFYLVVGEHVPYKRNDLAVEACNRLRRRLVVIGSGAKLEQIRRSAGPTVEVLGYQSDAVVRDHLRRCRALLFCGEEDFGLVPVEAQAAGRPVIAYGRGGATETVIDGQTGIFFDQQTPDAVAEAIVRLEQCESLLSPHDIQQHARTFDVNHFNDRIGRFLGWCRHHFQAGGHEGIRREMARIDRRAFLGQ